MARYSFSDRSDSLTLAKRYRLYIPSKEVKRRQTIAKEKRCETIVNTLKMLGYCI